MKYDRVLLISIDSLGKKYSQPFKKYFNNIYQNYQSTNTWTLPAYLGLLSSIYLPELYYAKKNKDVKLLEKIVKELPTLASIFKKSDWKTRAITGGGYLSKFFGWGKDWDNFKYVESPEQEWLGEKILPENKEFLFLHTYYLHNWWQEKPELKAWFTKNLELQNKRKEYQWDFNLLKDGEKAYKKRVRALSIKLKWIKDLPDNILVILTSDHSELFIPKMGSFGHANTALKNEEIFKVPLLVRTEDKKRKIHKEYLYDLYAPKLICDLAGIKYYSISDLLKIKESESKLEILEKHYRNLEAQLNLIRSSKFFKAWQMYRNIRDSILRKIK